MVGGLIVMIVHSVGFEKAVRRSVSKTVFVSSKKHSKNTALSTELSGSPKARVSSDCSVIYNNAEVIKKYIYISKY